MKKIIYTLITSIIINCPLISYAQDNTPAHFIAWGDEEGVVKRSGEDLKDLNEALPVLMRDIENTDKKDKIDALLHAGDFVRFDPNHTYYQNFLGKFLNIFYPTTGGDQEFYFGKYYNFLVNTPHLKKLYLDRVKQDGNGLEFYYNTIIKDTHIISLYSPDEYREPDKSPQFIGQNFYQKKDIAQYKWLSNLLEEIRTKNKDKRPIIILCHGPIFNQSKILTDLFEKYSVSLVISGDAHVFAHKMYKGTHYFVSGMMGDRAIGGCVKDGEENTKDPNFIEKYEICFPKEPTFRKKGEPFKFLQDHYLDIHISQNKLQVEVIELETGNIIEKFVTINK
ncbi:MAG: metallophosphoesterase [Cyanobacteriota bacterium]